MNYCEYCATLPDDNVHKVYHDKHYGFPIEDDNELFGRLILEINQAGLSWEIILKKEANFRKAYSNFSITQIAAYSQLDRERLLNDAGIIRNKLKVNAAIHNANKVLEIQQNFGTFKQWLDNHASYSLEEWVQLFRKHFKFVGGEIVNEFLMSTGYLAGAHSKNCPIFAETLKKKPIWKQIK